MKKNITIKDVAEKAGVSVATVSRALNPSTEYLVKPETQYAINKVCYLLKYVPKKAGRDLRKKSSRTIGLLVNFKQSSFSGYMQKIIEGIIEGLYIIKYDLKLISAKQFFSIQNILDSYGVDGVVMTHAYKEAFPNIYKEMSYKTKNLPVVIINDYYKDLKVNQLYVDGFKSTKELTSKVVDRGYTNFFFIGGEKGSPDAQCREKAFLKVLKEKNIAFDKKNIVNGHFSEECGYFVAKEKLKNNSSFRGMFFCANDAMALGALRAIGESNLRCPEDVAIVGYDGITMTEFSNPPISTVEVPLFEMGKEAIKILYEILEKNRKQKIQKKFPYNLKIRLSY